MELSVTNRPSGPFSSSAHVYDVVYGRLDYVGSAALVERLIRERREDAQSLLDMACGTGLHLSIWRDSFDQVEGADVDPTMLDVARNRLGPDIPLHQADYTDFDLGRTYDAVTCMFSSIGYAHTPERLDAAMAAMGRHLAPGGVMVVEPWLRPHMIEPPFLRAVTAEEEDVVVLRTTRHRYDEAAGISDMEFAYVVTTPEGSEFFTEHHLMGVFPAERYVEAMERAGLEAEFIEGGTEIGRGLAIGVQPG